MGGRITSKPRAQTFFKGMFGFIMPRAQITGIPQQKYCINLIEYFVSKNKYISGGSCYVLPLPLIKIINIAKIKIYF